jgi:hypothetical protein
MPEASEAKAGGAAGNNGADMERELREKLLKGDSKAATEEQSLSEPPSPARKESKVHPSRQWLQPLRRPPCMRLYH